MARPALPFLLVLAAVSVLLPGCKKKQQAGDKCNGDEVSCVGTTQALFCNHGALAPMSCRGPLGCVSHGTDDVDCDNSVAADKDGCNKKDDAACAADHGAIFLCDGEKFFTASTCKGPHGCTVKDDALTCDNDIADLGDPCNFDDDYACSSDKLLAMKCVGKKMMALNACRGPKRCAVHEMPNEKKTEFVCDDSIAQGGDPCDEEGEGACSADGKELYKCKSGRFEKSQTCSGPKGCQFDDATDKATCDTPAH
jgi:hypothetical protein